MAKRIEVVFTKDIDGVAREGEKRAVAAGFWRNYLLPRGLASTRKAKITADKVQLAMERTPVRSGAAANKAQEITARLVLSAREEKRAKRVERKEKKRAREVRKAGKLKKLATIN